MSEIRLRARADVVVTGRIVSVSSIQDIRYPTVCSKIVLAIYTITMVVDCIHKGPFRAVNHQIDFHGEHIAEGDPWTASMTLIAPPMPGEHIKAFLNHRHDGLALFHWSGLKTLPAPIDQTAHDRARIALCPLAHTAIIHPSFNSMYGDSI